MSANVETMFYAGVKPWHQLGVKVDEALSSQQAIKMAGLDWTVDAQPIQVVGGQVIDGMKANVRSSDHKVLGVVSDRYKIVQNADAFAFTDILLGEGVKYETAGSLSSGKRVWLLAKMETSKVCGDDVDPYLVFTNSHDGSGAVKVAVTPIRVVCQNTLTLALSTAKRTWSTKHCGDIQGKMDDARNTLGFAASYMENLKEEADKLTQVVVLAPQFADFLIPTTLLIDNVISYNNTISAQLRVLKPHIHKHSGFEFRHRLCFSVFPVKHFFVQVIKTIWGINYALNIAFAPSPPLPNFRDNFLRKNGIYPIKSSILIDNTVVNDNAPRRNIFILMHTNKRTILDKGLRVGRVHSLFHNSFSFTGRGWISFIVIIIA